MPAFLDWHDARHFDRTGDRPCRWCGRPTPLRDDQRRPSHKVCAENALNSDDGGPLPPRTGAAADPARFENWRHSA
ncbi:hypothetical protein PUR71_39580 [Streptomyces sp. SP17BM10]|uniref:hypothetical protein n=1 Tax=Streptomyces sp. SP17BM10 TaxID=3002530 RepID=UPI002E795E30|nr:hypothetical protein [Streptomyces sp. SP17BM10]MEE1788960.1 hypothetical protein [Streptomyces sp. SP17BM10]